jgi:hypothetical protein
MDAKEKPGTLLAGIGGGFLGALVGIVLGAIVGLAVSAFAIPQRGPMRTGGEEAVVDHLTAVGDRVMMLVFTGGGAAIGAMACGVVGIVMGIRRAQGPRPASPGFPVAPPAAVPNSTPSGADTPVSSAQKNTLEA